MSGGLIGAITYVKRMDVYACTKTKAARVQTPATRRTAKRFDVQALPNETTTFIP